MIPHAGLSVGDPYTIPVLISRGMLGYRPTNTIIELRQFIRPHKFDMRSVHNQMLIQGSTTNCHQSTQVGLPPWSLKYPHITPRPSHLMILHFPLVALPGFKFKQNFIHTILYQILIILIPLEVKMVLHVSGTNHSSSTVSYN
jgi:hypothetical protein